jgi:hypothetical protein
MNTNPVVVQGVITPAGTLEVVGKVPLPAGRVQVTVQPVPELPDDDPFWRTMKAIWAGQQARGHIPRSAEEVEAERRLIREEWEVRMRQIEQIQSEAQKARAATA